jgi:adenosylmethionine-8-amino-7-oxononanoate aminotransferase
VDVNVNPGHTFYRRMASAHPRAVRGEGIYIWDDEGRRYIDACGGALVVNIGHGVAEVPQAIARQAIELAFIHGTYFTSDVLEAYSDRLADLVPISDPRFFYLTSGSEAVEAALKFARQVQLARGQARRELTISRWGSYHGATLGALAVTGRVRMRTPFIPLFKDMPHIPAPYCYRCPFDSSFPDCGLACAQALEDEIQSQGPERVTAFIAEPIGGATLGAVLPPEGYWPKIRRICDRYDLLLLDDEVMTGFGRTGRMFALGHFNIQPDVMVCAKGITGGYFPFSLMAVREEDAIAIQAAFGDFNHGGTYSHHAVGAAAALATLEVLETHDLIRSAEIRGAYLGQRLQESLGDLPCVGDVRGLGMMWAVEFVADRDTKDPFPPECQFARRVCDLAFERGVIFYPGSGCVDGVRGDHLMVAPPFMISEEAIDTVIEVLRSVILIAWGDHS